MWWLYQLGELFSGIWFGSLASSYVLCHLCYLTHGFSIICELLSRILDSMLNEHVETNRTTQISSKQRYLVSNFNVCLKILHLLLSLNVYKYGNVSCVHRPSFQIGSIDISSLQHYHFKYKPKEDISMAKFACWMALMIVCSSISAVPAAVYLVGDSSGWSMGGGYGTWASDKTFALGDTLVFNYFPGHTVDEVSENDYNTCTTGNSITTDGSGATSIILSTAGPHYFICGVPGHCGAGMKLSVNVASSAGAASPSPLVTALPSPPATTVAPPHHLTTVAAPSPAPIAGVHFPGSSRDLTEPSSSAAVLSPAVAMLFTFCISIFLLA